jgi:hypothetical protein
VSLWSWLMGVNHAGDTPNANPASSVGPGSYDPGDPEGIVVEGELVEPRALPAWHPSPWSGWPSTWSTPNWDMSSRFNELVDVAWACLDINASALSTFPVYRTRSGRVIEPMSWMVNPDPAVYSSWEEFAKQLFWDFQLGEVFLMEMSSFSDGFPMRFRVMPPWTIHAEMRDGRRVYRLGGSTGPDVTESILHIRYKSTSTDARGIGPLEQAGGRMLTAGLIAKYVRDMASTGGVPVRTIDAVVPLGEDEARKLQDQYMASRMTNAAAPPVFDSGVKLTDHAPISPKEMAMLELEQFNESRIAVLLGVPPFLVGLPSGGDSMTYSNVGQLFDFHDRQKLRTLAIHVMSAISYWALPSGQKAELNRDEYSRPSFDQRADALVKLVTAEILSVEEARRAERFQSGDDTPAITAITGGEE